SDADAPGSIRDGSVGLGELRTGPDILDVWFESGSSWHAVMRTRFGDDAVPVELYLEGSDQHRGWFQTSMLPGIGLTGLPPYKKVLTHGFCVDIEGKKLSKSSGHTIEDLFDTYGADVLRWWVSSVAYEGDVKVDDELFKVAGESYRKIRNTIRFLLGNLYDFDAAADAVDLSGIEPTSLEAWALADLDRLTADVRRAYEAYDFRSAHQAIYDFCNDAMSATFLAATKDRLYCDRPDSARRRRTQTAMHRIADQLCRLVAPVLCHTADEAWRHLHGVEGDESVHAACYLEPAGVEVDHGWERALEARDAALKALEVAKAERGIENPLDAGLVLPDHGGALSRFDAEDLADLCGVSRASIGAVDAVE
ncbi:MAG: class I tRNA ligase family protein, partial [Planctomycetota bacterium]